MTIPQDDRALGIGNLIAAFSEEQIERIVGLTKGRLRYWARTDFFLPSYSEENKHLPFSRFYSFKDMVALRTLELLRVQNSVPMQHLRQVAAKLAHLKDSLWTKTTLFVVNKKVAIVNSETGRPEEVLSGQYVLGIPLAQVIKDTERDVIAFRSRPGSTLGKITRTRAIAHNSPIIAGTRIPVASVVRLTEDGYSVEQVIAEYPDLTPDDVTAALAHGSRNAA